MIRYPIHMMRHVGTKLSSRYRKKGKKKKRKEGERGGRGQNVALGLADGVIVVLLFLSVGYVGSNCARFAGT